MSQKKQHEIGIMAPLVQTVSVKAGCNLVADIGCGLGYLGQCLNELYNLKVVGFESKDSNCQGVRKPTTNSDTGSIMTRHMNVNASLQCTKAMRNAMVEGCPTSPVKENPVTCNNHLQSESCTRSLDAQNASLHDRYPRVCLVGLHCCGDLTPVTLHQFCELDLCQALVCMSCCYHRMSSDQDSKQFMYFPLSNELKQIYSRLTKCHGKTFNSFALRLACQETKTRWVSMFMV